MKPLVNVIMPVYNAEKYVKTALESVTAQDYENIKIYVIDDCSTDKTREQIELIAEKDSRVVFIPLSKNLGPSGARNRAMDMIEGEFFTFADSDDRMEKDHISHLMDMMDDNCVFTSVLIEQEKRNNKQFGKQKENISDFNLSQAKSGIVLDKGFGAFSHNKIFRSSVCGDLRFNEELMLCEDTVFCLNYLQRAKSGVVRYSTKKTYHYNKTKGSLSGCSCSEKKFGGIEKLNLEINNVRNANISDEYFITRLNAWWFLMLIFFVMYAKKLGKKTEKEKLKKEAEIYLADFKKVKKTYGKFYRRWGAFIFGLMRVFY